MKLPPNKNRFVKETMKDIVKCLKAAITDGKCFLVPAARVTEHTRKGVHGMPTL